MPLFIQDYRSVVMGAVCCLTFSGCAFTPANDASSNPADHTSTRITYLAADLTPALQQAQAGQQLQLAQSPWGSSATLTITERYFSAAGKSCVNAEVSASAQTQAVVLCQYPQQRWGATRALTKLLSQ